MDQERESLACLKGMEEVFAVKGLFANIPSQTTLSTL